MRIGKAAAAIAALFLCVQPGAAADLGSNFGPREQRTAAFAGVHVGMLLGGRRRAKPTARLQLSSAYYAREQSGGFVQTGRSPGLEFGAGKAGKATLFVAGQDTAEMRTKLGVGGTTTTLLIVGGLVLAVVILASLASAIPTPGPHKGAFD